MNPLVSIVIPTYNRYPYLIECLTLLLSFESADFEVVVQDNSEDTGPVEAFLRDCNDSRLRYFHDARFHYSQTENSELAVEKAVGDYVCYIGDDDALSREVVSAASWMKRMDVDALLFDGAPYYWPDVVFAIRSRVFRFGNSMPAWNASTRSLNIGCARAEELSISAECQGCIMEW